MAECFLKWHLLIQLLGLCNFHILIPPLPNIVKATIRKTSRCINKVAQGWIGGHIIFSLLIATVHHPLPTHLDEGMCIPSHKFADSRPLMGSVSGALTTESFLPPNDVPTAESDTPPTVPEEDN